MQKFYSNGKLLITGEYLVLDGAKALAIPTKYGQFLQVAQNTDHKIQWKSFDKNSEIWFESSIIWTEIEENTVISDYSDIKTTLVSILHFAFNLTQNKKLFNRGFDVETNLTFPRHWGLGTSSTLINNIAKWFQVDPFELLKLSFGGSGYDIACADTNKPIVYQRINQLPKFKPVDFYPSFHQHIYFLFLNQKQNSKAAITSYSNKRKNVSKEIEQISNITESLIKCENPKYFQKLLSEHEIILSNILEMQTVQEKLFNDFCGTIKSLGAWGGDFVMVYSEENPKRYFEEKGYKTLLKFQEMIL